MRYLKEIVAPHLMNVFRSIHHKLFNKQTKYLPDPENSLTSQQNSSNSESKLESPYSCRDLFNDVRNTEIPLSSIIEKNDIKFINHCRDESGFNFLHICFEQGRYQELKANQGATNYVVKTLENTFSLNGTYPFERAKNLEDFIDSGALNQCNEIFDEELDFDSKNITIFCSNYINKKYQILQNKELFFFYLREGNTLIVEWFLDNGYNPTITDINGKDTLYHASAYSAKFQYYYLIERLFGEYNFSPQSIKNSLNYIINDNDTIYNPKLIELFLTFAYNDKIYDDQLRTKLFVHLAYHSDLDNFDLAVSKKLYTHKSLQLALNKTLEMQQPKLLTPFFLYTYPSNYTSEQITQTLIEITRSDQDSDLELLDLAIKSNFIHHDSVQQCLRISVLSGNNESNIASKFHSLVYNAKGQPHKKDQANLTPCDYVNMPSTKDNLEVRQICENTKDLFQKFSYVKELASYPLHIAKDFACANFTIPVADYNTGISYASLHNLVPGVLGSLFTYVFTSTNLRIYDFIPYSFANVYFFGQNLIYKMIPNEMLPWVALREAAPFEYILDNTKAGLNKGIAPSISLFIFLYGGKHFEIHCKSRTENFTNQIKAVLEIFIKEQNYANIFDSPTPCENSDTLLHFPATPTNSDHYICASGQFHDTINNQF